jgi:hypothetical protein
MAASSAAGCRAEANLRGVGKASVPRADDYVKATSLKSIETISMSVMGRRSGLLLERRCDGARDGFGGCAGIGSGDLHRRRDDFRISRDRKDRECAQAERRDKNAEHGCETGTIDEEMCQAHVVDSVQTFL